MNILEGGASYKSFGTSALERVPVIASPYVRLAVRALATFLLRRHFI
jgi:hypothetical protein